MSVTATNYINLINNNFPVRGQDNDSQGFRDNFTNISNALKSINQELDYVDQYAVIATNSTNTFYGNTISDVNLSNYSTELYDNGQQSGNIVIDYTLGNYQQLELNPGSSNISVINWPSEGTVGQMTLEITPTLNESASVTFVDSQSTQTYYLNNGINLFGLYNVSPVNGTPQFIATVINQPFVYSTSTVASEFILLENGSETEFFFNVNTATGSSNAVTLSTNLVGETYWKAGNLALVPNIVTSTVVGPQGYNNVSVFLNSVEGIYPGATFVVPGQNYGIIEVTSVGVANTSVSFNSIPGFNVTIGTQLIFKNQPFSTSTVYSDVNYAYPQLSTLVSNSATNSLGTLTNFAGSIYANENQLQVTYQDPDNINTNTFIINTMPQVSAVSETSIADTSTNLATAFFVHSVLPFGSITMWYGNDNNVPYGWAICDGNSHTFNGQSYVTPDLRDKFIVGASSTNNNGNVPATKIIGTNFNNNSTSTGGTSVTQLVDHIHTLSEVGNPAISVSITDPGHNHPILVDGSGDTDQQVLGYGASSESAIGLKAVDNGNYSGKAYESNTGQGDPFTESEKTGITASATATGLTGLATDTTGTIAPNTNFNNIPPFIAVYYIMKISGYGIDPRSTLNPSIVSNTVSQQYY